MKLGQAFRPGQLDAKAALRLPLASFSVFLPLTVLGTAVFGGHRRVHLPLDGPCDEVVYDVLVDLALHWLPVDAPFCCTAPWF